jgi:tetratricopeptide (TPR) repeat protein
MLSNRKNRIAILSSLIAIVVASVALLANVTQIAQWFGVDVHQLRRERSTDAIIESVLHHTSSFQRVTFDRLEEFIRLVEEDARNAKTIIERQKAYLIAGQFREASGEYRKALKYFTIAMELNTRIGDPYYAMGNLYYDIALLDLIIKRRFVINTDQLICTLNPDDETKKIFEKITQEYHSGSTYPLIHDIIKSRLIVTSLHIVEYRKRQIAGTLKGNSVINLHRLEMMKLAVWVPAAFPKDKELISKTMTLSKNLITYAIEHPDEFVGLLPLGEIMKKSGSNGSTEVEQVAPPDVQKTAPR